MSKASGAMFTSVTSAFRPDLYQRLTSTGNRYIFYRVLDVTPIPMKDSRNGANEADRLGEG